MTFINETMRTWVCFSEEDKGKENLETRVCKIGKEGWPNLECQEE